MAITLEEKSQGAAILKIFEYFEKHLPILKFSLRTGKSRNCFIIEGNKTNFIGSGKSKTCGIYIKLSNKRVSPWAYNFHKSHQIEILDLFNKYGEVFIVFVNGNDGFASISYNELKELLDDNFEDQENITISRKLRGSYVLKGNDGERNSSLRQNNFPGNVASYFSDLAKK